MLDWIQGDKFSRLSSDKIFYCNTHDVNYFFKNCNISNPFILITHNSDGYITDNPRYVNTLEPHHHADVRLMPKNLHKWYGCMVEYDSDKIFSLPLGVENNNFFRNKENFITKQITNKIEKNTEKLIYVNFKISNNYSERIEAYNAVCNSDFCTFSDKIFNEEQFRPPVVKFPHVDRDPYEIFAEEVSRHEFVICPVGNGLESHRLWETLYLKSIPIVKRNLNYSFYENKLPILFVDNWNEINRDLLLKKRDEINNKLEKNLYNLDMLNFSYWKNLIIQESKKI